MNWMRPVTGILYIAIMILYCSANADLPASDDELESFTKPSGIDLDVTYIRRTPLYNRYQVAWQDEMPILAPGTENDKRWPDYGETVTFTAHFMNKGTIASGSFQYSWHIDGVEVGSGTYTSLDPGEEGMTTQDWLWDHVVVNERLQGQHTVTFTVDSEDLISETYETNNSLTDRTDALSLCYQIKPEVYAALEIPVDTIWPFSAEDWIQKQITALNDAFVRSVHTLSPEGVTERVRIDQILVREDDDIGAAMGSDGLWFQHEDSRGYPYWDATTDVDWGTPHEIGHQLLGLIDTYALDFASQWGGSNVPDQSGRPVLLSRDYPDPGLMNSKAQYFGEENSIALNLSKGFRRGYYGEYLFDTPDQTMVLVLDNQGNPASGVNVAFFQQSPDPPPRIDNNPEISATTDDSGLVVLPNRPVSGSVTTKTGHTYRDNPFGNIESFGGPGNIFLVRIQQGTHEEFMWLDITNFNRLVWAGLDVLQVESHVPPAAAPAPPENFRFIRQENTQVELQWDPSPTPGVTRYNVYRTEEIDHQWTLVAGGITERSFTASTYGIHSSAGFAVTSIAESGLESGFSDLVWTLHIWSPTAVTIDDNNNRQIAASGNLLASQDQNGQFLKWLGTYTEWVAYWANGWHHPEEQSHMVFDDAGNTIYSVPSQHEVVIGILESQGPFRSFGSYGSAPGQFDTPTGVALWGKPCEFGGPYSVDEHTLLLAHYDGDLGGEQGEVAIASGISYERGMHGQGVLIDSDDSLAYTRDGNLESWQGTIEFWIRPNWDGDDEGFHELFQVKEDFYDYSNHTMWLGKDPGGNIGSWGGIYVNIDDWSAGEWHHIAIIWEGPDVALYIDGKSRQTGQGDPRDFIAGMLNVGSSCCSSGNQVNAIIDELRISDIPRIGNSDTCEHILVADSGNNRIQAFDNMGNFIDAYGSSGTGAGQFNNPQGLAMDALDNLIVVDSGNNRLQVLNFDGMKFTFLKEVLGDFSAPRDVAVPNHDQIVVADTGNNSIKVLDDKNNLLATYLEPNDGVYGGHFSQPNGVAVDLTGKIIVADTLNNRVAGISSPYVSPPISDFMINVGLNGAWFNPATSGQGQLIDLDTETQFMFLTWFTYTNAGSDNPSEQHWFTAQGNYDGNRAKLTLYETLGGRFDDPQEVKTNPVGEVTLNFTDCESGVMGYDIETLDVQGSFPMRRVISGSENICDEQNTTAIETVDINAGMDGAWFDENTSGQGFLIDVHPNPEGSNFIFLAWFTYGDETATGQRWLTAQGDFEGSVAEIDVHETTGGTFDAPLKPDTVKVGTMRLDFTDCNNASLSYDLTNDQLNGTVAIKRVIPGTEALCQEIAGAD